MSTPERDGPAQDGPTTGPAHSALLPILGRVDAACGLLVHAAREAGLQPALCATPEPLRARAAAAGAGLVLVQRAALSIEPAEVLHRLRGVPALRVVLVGPGFGSLAHALALQDGYDEVWPDDLPPALLSLMLRKAHGRAQPAPAPGPRPRPVPPPKPRAAAAVPGLRVSLEDSSLLWHGRVVPLSPGSAALLHALWAAEPYCATREQLAQALPARAGRQAPDAARRGIARFVDMQVCRLRRELAAGGVPELGVSAVRGRGYRLRLPG